MFEHYKNKLFKFIQKHRNLILYGIIGLSGVAIDFALFIILIKFNIPASIASIISVSAGIINNFIWNAHYNFKRTDHLWWRFIGFYIIGATGVALSVLSIIVLHDIVGLNSILSKIISVPFIVIFQYFFNKRSSLAENYRSIPWRQLLLFVICIFTVVIFIFNAPYYNFVDEADSLLGGQFVSQGGALYIDYFSHHMPLTYFISAPLFMILGTKIIAIKVMFSLFMVTWILVMSRHLLKKYGIYVFAFFVLIIGITQTLSRSHMLLAETLAAFSMVHALILLLTRDNRNIWLSGDLAVFALLGCIPILSSLPYAPLSLLIYTIAIIELVEHRKKIRLFHIIYSSVIALLPYIALLAYLIFNKAVHEFLFQALDFNTLYYSQFTPEAPISLFDGFFSIIQGSLDGIKGALTFRPGVLAQPLPFLFTATSLLSVIYLFTIRKYLIGIIFTIALFFGSSRRGFSNILADNGNTRSGTIILFIGILLFCYILFTISKEKLKYQTNIVAKVIPIMICTTLLMISLTSIIKMADVGRLYVRNHGTASPVNSPDSNAYIINLINKPSDTYWVGPIDFSSQLIISSQNASIYRFYLPWHAACGSCTEEIKSDITNKKPKVVSFDANAAIWNIKTSEYAKSIIEHLNSSYYQVGDSRLRSFHFLRSDMQRINEILIESGYSL